jgi:hypothetical protein
VGHRDQLYPFVQPAPQFLHAHQTVGVHGQHLQSHPLAFGQVEQEEVTTAVFHWRDEHAIAGPQWNAGECHCPGPRGAVEQGDFLAVAVEQGADSGMPTFDCLRGAFSGLVRTYLALQPQMAHHRVDDGLRREAGASVVQVCDVVHAGRIRPRPHEIEVHQ